MYVRTGLIDEVLNGLTVSRPSLGPGYCAFLIAFTPSTDPGYIHLGHTLHNIKFTYYRNRKLIQLVSQVTSVTGLAIKYVSQNYTLQN